MDGPFPPPIPGSFAFRLDETIVDLTVGRTPCVLVAGGRVLCEDDEDREFKQVPLSAEAVALSAGALATCALLATGRVSCWGCSGPPGADTLVRLALPALKSIAVGTHVACGATEDDRVVCWGQLDHASGHNGSGACRDLETETIAGKGAGIGALALSPEAETAALWVLRRDGRVARRAERPRLNEGYSYDLVRRWSPLIDVPARGRVVELGVGGMFEDGWFPWVDGCTLSLTGNVRCQREPLKREGVKGDRFERSYVHACGLLGDGTIACWGDNRFGQAPPRVELTQPATALAVGGDHGCALLADRTVTCWGAAGLGAPAPATAPCPGSCRYTACDPQPHPVPGLTRVRLLRTAANGSPTTCAVTDDHWLVCWNGYDGKVSGRPNCDTPVRSSGDPW